MTDTLFWHFDDESSHRAFKFSRNILNYPKNEKRGDLMPFPDVNSMPFATISCRTPNEVGRGRIFTRVVALSRKFEIDDKVPVRAAAVAYLGLCRLKQAHDHKNIDPLVQRCRELMAEFQPEVDGPTVNCSWFIGEKGKKFQNHAALAENAMALFLPGIRSKKKQALILLALGTEHERSVPIPPDDKWIGSYVFG